MTSHPRNEHPKREIIRIAWQFGFFLLNCRPKRIPIQSLAVSEILFIFATECLIKDAKDEEAGVVLAGVVDMGINKIALSIVGLTIVLFFGVAGFFLYILGNQSKL